MRRAFEECEATSRRLCEARVRRAMVELETGGNVRLEEGKPTDAWFRSCAELAAGRFFEGDYRSEGRPGNRPTGFRVTRVTRVHNRHLRSRFDAAVESRGENAVATASATPAVEYLLVGEDPTRPSGDLERVAEEGFRTAEEHAEAGFDEAVTLYNSVSLADDARIRAARDAGDESWTRGRLLVTKTFVGRSTREVGDENTGDAGWPGSKIRRSTYPGYDSTYRCRPSDPKQRAWYAFDRDLALPEYLIEFEYERLAGASASSAAAGVAAEGEHARYLHLTDPAAVTARGKAEVEKVPFDVWAAARPLAPFLEFAATASEAAERAPGTETTPFTVASGVPAALALVDAPPVIPPRRAFPTVAAGLAATGMPAATLSRLNLHGCGVSRVDGLGGCRNLRALDLSFNRLTKIEGLETLAKLERLDLGFNAIKRIEGLSGLESLLELDINDNALFRLEDLNAVKRHAPNLTSLNLRANALSDNKAYRGLVLRRLTRLQSLDGVPVTARDREEAAESSSTLTAALVRKHAKCRRRDARGGVGELIRSVRETSVGDHGRRKESTTDVVVDDDHDAWWESVEEISLERRHVRRLTNLDRLTRMRRASFAQNEISRVEGLEACVQLEELNLEDNRLVTIEGLQTLSALRKLDLGKNRITRLENLSPHLSSLSQLSLEDNGVTSLRGLAGLHSLMELYVGNNKISETREVQHLKTLPKLIILDMVGNPACDLPDYRHYVVYYLRRVKVLDGVGVEASDLSAAKSKYAGRLTREHLEEKIGRRFFNNVRVLDLSAARIREIGDVFTTGSAAEFDAVEELNLESNALTRVDGVCALPRLKTLRLSGNRVENNALWSPEALRAALRAKNTRVSEERPGAGVFRTVEDVASTDDDETLAERHSPFPALRALHLRSNGVSSVASLNLTVAKKTLRVLHLQENDISRLDGLAGLRSLEELALDRNRVKSVEPGTFDGLVNLRELRMEENGLKSLSNFEPLVRLRALRLSCNRVAEVSEVEKLGALAELRELTLASNPVTRKQVYRPMALRHCENLRALDGKEVTDEERHHVEYLFSPVDAAAAAAAEAAANFQPGGPPALTHPQLLNNGARLGANLGGVPSGSALAPYISVGVSNASVGGLLGTAGLVAPPQTHQKAAAGGGGVGTRRAAGMNIETMTVHASAPNGAGGGGANSRERIAALREDLKRRAVQTVARQRASQRQLEGNTPHASANARRRPGATRTGAGPFAPGSGRTREEPFAARHARAFDLDRTRR